MTACDDPRLRLARRALGEIDVTDEPGLPPRLLKVVDPRGHAYVVKEHQDADRFAQEIRAYTTHLRHMRDITATLVAHDAESRTLLLSHLPGRDCDGISVSSEDAALVHRRAGAALRRLHDSSPENRTSPAGPRLAGRMREWIARADHAGILSPDDHRRLRAHALRLSTTAMEGTICHLDYQPRNWRVHYDELFIVDFEHTRPDARVRDFARLEHRHWTGHPALRSAFFAGYGQALSTSEQDLLHLFGALEAVTALVRGHENGDTELFTHGRALLRRLA
ncbi:phosphotransferase [Streptantibioticus silvisoli]|uniref:Aminoglycoside phosphotransferase family protein n=1 Tax=Streptantibioticus silvisoli TaxID=2705255 RepID=A0ABT6W033_9ACTN|nr:phosphotransferase [Streptantibioticus silvisoli]MDI5964102.1 aminoglycoside phosphotransferase family protein [Streptantibioticus silvisoli]